jgi:hypothetical protein
MMSFSLPVRSNPPDSLASRIGWRAEVCPPSLRQAPRSAWARLWFWLLAPGPLQASPSLDRLPPVRQDFLDTLGELQDAAARGLRLRISQSRTLRELWHLRTELYRVVALNHSQNEAERRVATLNRHFPTRSPRSGFAPLLP